MPYKYCSRVLLIVNILAIYLAVNSAVVFVFKTIEFSNT